MVQALAKRCGKRDEERWVCKARVKVPCRAAGHLSCLFAFWILAPHSSRRTVRARARAYGFRSMKLVIFVLPTLYIYTNYHADNNITQQSKHGTHSPAAQVQVIHEHRPAPPVFGARPLPARARRSRRGEAHGGAGSVSTSSEPWSTSVKKAFIRCSSADAAAW